VNICTREGISINQLAANIAVYVAKYGPQGSEAAYGKKSNNSFINALKRFEEFCKI
jgi:hypothetical protein